MSTLVLSCLPDDNLKSMEAVAYIETFVRHFQTLPTYTFLSKAGIIPSTSTTYILLDMLSAVRSGSGGFTPAINCHDGSLVGVSWYFNLKGSIIDRTLVTIDAPTDSLCPSDGINTSPRRAPDIYPIFPRPLYIVSENIKL
ncbi:ribonuclease T2-like [Haplosporangium bisporale]|nr:ribonuclease T2-like [Haplosporangium bisporale]